MDAPTEVKSVGHTPGPWKHRQSSVYLDQIVAESGLLVVPDTEMSTADARLIAAAPELLDNLVLSTRFLELEAEGHRLRGDHKKAEACEGQAHQNRAAIAKAEGR